MVNRDIFDEVAEEDKDIFAQTQSTEESSIEKLKSDLSSMIDRLDMKERKSEKEKMTLEVTALIKAEVAKIKPVQNIIERQIEQVIKHEQIIKHEQTVKHIQVPVNLPNPVIPPQKIREIIREVRIEPNENGKQYAELKAVNELIKQIEDLKKEISAAKKTASLVLAMRGGSGVIGIPPPGGQRGKFLSSDGISAYWVSIASGGVITPFAIASFSDGQSSPLLIGSGVWKSAGTLSFIASYTNGPATSGVISSSGLNNLNLTNSFQGPTLNAQDINYPSVGGSVVFSLAAGGDNGTANSSVSHLFANNRYWGVSTKSSGFNSGDVTGLATNDIADSRANSFSVSPGIGQYIVYAYPTRLGLGSFSSNGFQGGFNDPETVSITNANGFTENYYVYASINSNLGTTNVVVS